jgi:actin
LWHQEKLVYVGPDVEFELQKTGTTTDCNRSDILPDGNGIVIGNEWFRCPELLFKPLFNGID